MNIQTLGGCSSSTIALYLKGIGIFRTISQQIDSSARAWWNGECFQVATTLSTEALESFFLNSYIPTPLVAPWNRGSGFFTKNDKGLTPFEQTNAKRFSTLRDAITETKKLLGEMEEADRRVRKIKEETKLKNLSAKERKALRESEDYKQRLNIAEKHFKELKVSLLPNCRLGWRGKHREWMDAAIVLGDEGDPKYPAMFGTGGADGRLDFTNNFFQRLQDLFDVATDDGSPQKDSAGWLKGALWGTPANQCQKKSPIGQFFPGTAGGANNTNGPMAESLLNPFDYVLMLEGAVVFRSNATKKMGTRQANRAAVPFYVSSCGVGYPSASQSDEGARGEQWLPLWNQPLNYREFQHLLSEGRAQLGARPAHDPIDLARAVASLGVSPGIRSFQRFGYIERNGQANFAVPLGRFDIPDHASPILACLDDLDTWLIRLRRAAREKTATGRLVLSERRFSEALLAVIRQPKSPGRWQTALLAMERVEAALRVTTDRKCDFIPPLRPEWVRAADDGSAEFRLAVSFGLQHQARRHWLPRKNEETAVVMQGRSGCDDAIAFLRRRLVEASQQGKRQPVFFPATRAGTRLTDIASILSLEANLDRILSLARPLMAIHPKKWKNSPCPPEKPSGKTLPPEAWMVLRLAHLFGPLVTGETIRCDPAILRRLESGDLPSAVGLASGRVRVAGLAHPVAWATAPVETARLWAAALAFPIDTNTASWMGRTLNP